MEDINFLKKLNEKNAWIHHEYVQLIKPFGTRGLTDNERREIKRKMKRIDSEADKRFGIMKGI